MATLSRALGEAANQAGCARAVRGRAASARLWHGHAGLGPCPHRPGCPTPCQPGRCARTGVLVGASGRRAFRAPVWPHLAVRVDRAKVALGGPAALATTLGCSLVFLAAHPVGALAAAVSLDSFIRVFDVDTGASVATLEAPPSEVWCVQFHPKAINACETPSEQVHNKLKPAGSKCLCNTKYLRNWIQHVLKEKFVTIKNWIALPKEVWGTTSVWLKFMKNGSPQPGGRAFGFLFSIVCTNLSIIYQTQTTIYWLLVCIHVSFCWIM